MFEIMMIVVAIIAIALLIPYLIWRLMFGGQLRYAILTFFNIAHERDMKVDPEAEIIPSTRQPISDVMKQQAEMAKGGTSIQAQDVPQASIPATTSGINHQYTPPYRQKPVRIEDMQQAQNNNVIVTPPQPLVEDRSFKVDDPIIDDVYIDPETPSADTLDAHVPDYDSSPYGVRSADHSPGRRLRDKRYRRNASS